MLSCPHTSDQRTQNIRDMLEDVISSSFRQHTSGPYFFLFARRPSILAGERLARGRDRPLHVAKVGPDAGLDPKLLAQVQASRPGNEPGNEPGLVQSCQAATLARFGCVDVKGPTKNIGPRVRTEVDPRCTDSESRCWGWRWRPWSNFANGWTRAVYRQHTADSMALVDAPVGAVLHPAVSDCS